jgi:hypothetical protein
MRYEPRMFIMCSHNWVAAYLRAAVRAGACGVCTECGTSQGCS